MRAPRSRCPYCKAPIMFRYETNQTYLRFECGTEARATAVTPMVGVTGWAARKIGDTCLGPEADG